MGARQGGDRLVSAWVVRHGWQAWLGKDGWFGRVCLAGEAGIGGDRLGAVRVVGLAGEAGIGRAWEVWLGMV